MTQTHRMPRAALPGLNLGGTHFLKPAEMAHSPPVPHLLMVSSTNVAQMSLLLEPAGASFEQAILSPSP